MRRARLAALVLALASPGFAAPDCEALAERAAAAEGIPPGLLSAVARVESGRGTSGGGRRAWPWTLNAGGRGSFHDSAAAALAQLDAHLATGTTNVDLGCMQLNWHWHGAAFAGAAAMLDPVANTAHAARFLRSLHAETGSWTAAVALYHSRDPARGEAYTAKVAAELGAAPGPPSAEMPAAPRLRGILVLARAPLTGGGAGGDLFRRRPGLGLGRPAD